MGLEVVVAGLAVGAIAVSIWQLISYFRTSARRVQQEAQNWDLKRAKIEAAQLRIEADYEKEVQRRRLRDGGGINYSADPDDGPWSAQEQATREYVAVQRRQNQAQPVTLEYDDAAFSLDPTSEESIHEFLKAVRERDAVKLGGVREPATRTG